MSGHAPLLAPLLAVPSGRILGALAPLFRALALPLVTEDERRLLIETGFDLRLVRLRAFDVARVVSLGGAEMGIVGADVLLEFGEEGLYRPLDLRIGACRLCLAVAKGERKQPLREGHVRVATKYPNVTKAFFARKGLQAECIKLHGSVEIAPILQLSSHVVDLVSTGRTLRENGLEITETIAHSTCMLIVNRMAWKLRRSTLQPWIERFREASEGRAS